MFFYRSYSSIVDNEQRKRYKADFTADYKEYRDLHAEVESVSKRFAQLEERLRQEEKNSPAWRVICFFKYDTYHLIENIFVMKVFFFFFFSTNTFC